MAMRLDKLLAHYGIGTRKEVKTYIRKGYVQVNGQIIKKDDFKVDYEKDHRRNIDSHTCGHDLSCHRLGEGGSCTGG